MMRRTHVGERGQKLVEPELGMADVIADALRLGVGVSVHA